MGGLAGSLSIATRRKLAAGWPWRIEVGGSCIGWREEEETNETDVDVQGWWEGLRDPRLAERSEVGRLGEGGIRYREVRPTPGSDSMEKRKGARIPIRGLMIDSRFKMRAAKESLTAELNGRGKLDEEYTGLLGRQGLTRRFSSLLIPIKRKDIVIRWMSECRVFNLFMKSY